MSADAEKALDRIRLMLHRTTKNGASESEVDAAARHIGRLIMKFPELLGQSVHDSPRTGWPKPPPRKKTPASDDIAFFHSGIRGESAQAILVVIRGEKYWLQKSQLTNWNQSEVIMSRWIAIEKGLI
jgi:hypothetical protein